MMENRYESQRTAEDPYSSYGISTNDVEEQTLNLCPPAYSFYDPNTDKHNARSKSAVGDEFEKKSFDASEIPLLVYTGNSATHSGLLRDYSQTYNGAVRYTETRHERTARQHPAQNHSVQYVNSLPLSAQRSLDANHSSYLMIQPGTSLPSSSGMTIERNHYQQPRRDISTHFKLSIFVLLCCAWPCGLSALLKAIKAKKSKLAGNYSEARYYGRNAEVCNIIGIICGILNYTALGVYWYCKLKDKWDH